MNNYTYNYKFLFAVLDANINNQNNSEDSNILLFELRKR